MKNSYSIHYWNGEGTFDLKLKARDEDVAIKELRKIIETLEERRDDRIG